MTQAREHAVETLKLALTFAGHIAGLQVGTTLTPILQDRAKRERELYRACVDTLAAGISRTPPQPAAGAGEILCQGCGRTMNPGDSATLEEIFSNGESMGFGFCCTTCNVDTPTTKR